METVDRLEVYYDGKHVGTMAPYQRYRTAFEYSQEWLRDGFSISPFSLPLVSGVKIAKSDPFDGIFGIFADSLPDGWGRLLEEVLNGKYVSEKASERILTDLKNQTVLKKIPAGVPSGIETGNKTGELDNVDNDAAIVWSPNATYILVIMSSDTSGRIDEIRKLSSMVYNSINGQTESSESVQEQPESSESADEQQE